MSQRQTLDEEGSIYWIERKITLRMYFHSTNFKNLKEKVKWFTYYLKRSLRCWHFLQRLN